MLVFFFFFFRRKSILLSRGGYRLEAIDALVHSINLQQYNWSAWKLLQKLIEGADEVRYLSSALLKIFHQFTYAPREKHPHLNL
jgi:hypothetical protein